MKVNNDENIKKLADKEFLKKLYEILELMGWVKLRKMDSSSGMG